MNINNPCKELKMQNSHWNMSLRSPTATMPKAHVVPNKTEHANAMRTEARFSLLGLRVSFLSNIASVTSISTMKFCIRTMAAGRTTPTKNGKPRITQLKIKKVNKIVKGINY